MEKTNITAGAAPRDLDLEKRVLTALLSRSSFIDDVREILSPDCFYDHRNRAVYSSIARLHDSGRRPDLTLVCDDMERHGEPSPMEYLFELGFGSAVTTDLTEYALILREYSVRRQLWETGLKLLARSADLSVSVADLHAETKESLESSFDQVAEDLVTLRQAYADLQEEMMLNRSRAEGETAGTPTGFTEIDANGGLRGSDLIVVGAETSQGKTAFATALTVSALLNGRKVAFYSMEMTQQQIAARIAAMMSGIEAKRIKGERLTDAEISLVDSAMDRLPQDNLFFDGSSTSSLEKILLSIRKMKAKQDISGAVVDYLQLVHLEDRNNSPEQRAAKVARRLKNIAKELDIWVIAISQLRRDSQSPEPTMARLRDSGQIEEAADNIFLIYRPRDGKSYPEPFKSFDTEGTAMVKMAKGRNTGTGEFLCGFDPKTTLFYPRPLSEIRRTGAPGFAQSQPRFMTDYD